MREDRIDRPESGWHLPGVESGRDRPIVRTRIDGFTCHLAYPLSEDERRQLIASLATPARARAVPPSGGVLSGRAAIWRHEIPSIGSVVIKEYRRGGMLRFIRRRYYVRFRTARPEREFNNLMTARAAGLNVPDPVACFSRGALFYRGWLATRFIPGRSLVDVVSTDTGALPALMDDLMRQVRLLIKNRVAHVDLHPGNVLVDATGTLYLLDFDRAIVSTKSLQELRDQYDVRWKRAVEKHGLPGMLADRFSAGLYGLSHRDD
ncbi:MAG: hypothetical protein IMZ55_06655 [Acidobacteria bacterium]|nr:hypothetical protein [Acidobacteriota bacterium]